MPGHTGSGATGVDGVESFWLSDRGRGRRDETVLPTGRGQVVIDLETGAGVLIGPRTRPTEASVPLWSTGFTLTGVGVGRIVGPSAESLVDRRTDLSRLDVETAEVLERPHDPVPALRRLAIELLSRHDIDPRIGEAERRLRAGATAREARRTAGMDRRRFVPEFRRATGLAPKRYETLLRFQQAVRVVRTDDETHLAAAAAVTGFADQPHMTRVFNRLAALSPGRLRRLPPGPPNHLDHEPRRRL